MFPGKTFLDRRFPDIRFPDKMFPDKMFLGLKAPLTKCSRTKCSQDKMFPDYGSRTKCLDFTNFAIFFGIACPTIELQEEFSMVCCVEFVALSFA
jgi:hypothetical protein